MTENNEQNNEQSIEQDIKINPVRKTNLEVVADLMEHGYHGALMQVFVIEAIRFYSELVVKGNPKPTEPGPGFISAITWYEVAEETKLRLEQHYEPNKTQD